MSGTITKRSQGSAQAPAEPAESQKTPVLSGQPPPGWHSPALMHAWWGAVLLAVVGAFTAVIRYLLPRDVHVMIVTLLLGAYGTEQEPVLFAHPFTEHWHRIGGIAYMALGLLQLHTGFQKQFRQLHRISGRIFLGVALLIAYSGAYIALVFPYAASETVPSLLAAALMTAFAVKSYLCIRATPRDTQGHSEWGTRCFAIGLGIGLLRILLIVLIRVTPFSPRQLMTPAMWVAWTSMLALGEWSIRKQRALVADWKRV